MRKQERLVLVEELFHAALALDPSQRTAFLDSSCGSDPDLRAEVQSLISMHEAPGDFLNLPAYEIGASLLGELQATSLTGKPLGHYKILDCIGTGGMGEVYRASDTHLDRSVAIKVLPDIFSGDPERLARFEREAKLLASLDHPNIAAIHGLEETDGRHFLVLELVEGETLAQRLSKGPLPVDEALEICRQIAEGMEAAHERGIIHRDLKPANVKITPQGKVKLLDFGLAKVLANETPSVDSLQSPTITETMTRPGAVLGTAAYMSPEQATGKPVDKRADIWAFGVVLFEMLTGQQLFKGETVSETLAAVLKSEPEWKRLPPNLHPRIRLLLERCLEKEAKNRYSGISDARVDIQKVLGDPSGVLVRPVTTVEPRSKLRTILPWVAASVVIASIIVGLAVWKLKPTPLPEPRQVNRFCYELPKDQQFSNPVVPNLAVSPDGRQFAYSTSKGLYLRSMDELDARLIPGTAENPWVPFFSPDGQWLGYWSGADRKLKKISIRGGAPVTLCDAVNSTGANWGVDNTIVYSQYRRGIVRVSGNGGIPETIVDGQKETIAAPQILPDGKTVLFTLATSQSFVVVQSLKSGKRKVLFAGDRARYVPTGHLVYALGNNLFAIPFDLDRFEVVGGPVPMVEVAWQSGTNNAPQYAISDSGTLVYVPGAIGTAGFPQCTLVWVDRNGKEEPIAAPPNAYASPKISPDGTRVALFIRDSGGNDIWIWDLVRKTMTRL
jgi:serine/threonine-protein kinase